jgi:prophage tail gpP-like protein
MPNTAVYPNPYEIAEIRTKFGIFKDWQSVWVQHRWADGWALFRFTAAEFSPMPIQWSGLRFLPGDTVDIYLGGAPALLNGLIVDRQVGYDGASHAVELSGRSTSWKLVESSIDQPPGSFDGRSFVDIATQVLAPYGAAPKIIGSPNSRPFTNVQNQKGEKIWDFLENLARPRGIVLGSDYQGNFLIIGDHAFVPSGDLVEGQNILKLQCTISIRNMYGIYGVSSQSQNADDQAPGQANEQEAHVDGQHPDAPKNILSPSPVPTKTLDELQEMAHNEAKWSDGTFIEATITTTGWFKPRTTSLWQAGDIVNVYSPMAPLNTPMKIRNVTFTQDRQSGTLTTLDLVIPWLLNDKITGVTGLIPPPGTPAAESPLTNLGSPPQKTGGH